MGPHPPVTHSQVQFLELQLKLLERGPSFPPPASQHGTPGGEGEEGGGRQEEQEQDEVAAGRDSKFCVCCFGRPERAEEEEGQEEDAAGEDMANQACCCCGRQRAEKPHVGASAARNAAEPASRPGPLVLPTIVFAQFAGTSLWYLSHTKLF